MELCRDKRIYSTGCAGTYSPTILGGRWSKGTAGQTGGPSGRQVFGGNGELIYEDSDENTKLTDCYYEKKDWRLCKDEVSLVVVVLEKGKMR